VLHVFVSTKKIPTYNQAMVPFEEGHDLPLPPQRSLSHRTWSKSPSHVTLTCLWLPRRPLPVATFALRSPHPHPDGCHPHPWRAPRSAVHSVQCTLRSALCAQVATLVHSECTLRTGGRPAKKWMLARNSPCSYTLIKWHFCGRRASSGRCRR